MGNGASCFYPEGRDLLRSAEAGDVSHVKGVLTSDVALARYRTLTMGNTAWHKAAKRGRLEVLMEMTTMLEAALLQQGKTLDTKDPAKALWKLGGSSKQIIAKLINQRNHRGQTPLMLACAEGHAGCVKFLAESGADPFVADKMRGQTCLHYAALANSEDTIKELLKTIEGPQSQGAVARLLAMGNMSGLTPLHYACFAEKLEAVKMLLQFKPNIMQGCEYGDMDWISIDAGSTPLHVAALKGNTDIVKALLKAYVEVSGDLMPGSTSPSGGSSPTRRRDPRALRNEYGKLPYHLAVRRAHFHLTDWLDPSVPLRWLLTGEELNTSSEFGPPRLAVVAASVLHHKLMKQLDTIEALGLIRMSEQPAGAAGDAEASQPSTSGTAGPAGGATSVQLAAAAEALSRHSSRRTLSRAASKKLAEHLLRGMHRRASSSGRGLNPLLDEAILEQAAELCKMSSAPVEFTACMPLGQGSSRRVASRRQSQEPSLAGSPEQQPELDGSSSRSAASSRRTSRDGGVAGAGPMPGGERLGTVEEANSRASSVVRMSALQRAMQESPFATASASGSQCGDDSGSQRPSCSGSTSSLTRAKSAPQPRSSADGEGGDTPLASVSMHGGGAFRQMFSKADSAGAGKLEMLARIRIDVASERTTEEDAGPQQQQQQQQQLTTATSMLSAAPSALLDAVLKPFRRSASKVAGLAEISAAAAAAADDEDDEDVCGVCLDVDVNAYMRPCSHRICVTCARDLCRRYTVATALCPYCRAIIADFEDARMG